jgi:hypothetical protein
MKLAMLCFPFVSLAQDATSPPGFGSDSPIWGISVSDAGDVDGDGHADVAVIDASQRWLGRDIPALHVFSGRTGEIVHRIATGVAPPKFGRCVDACADVDGDGVGELLLIAHAERGGKKGPCVIVYSGKTGAELRSILVEQREWLLDGSVSSAGDMDGDSAPDFVACVYREVDDAEKEWNGCSRAYSGKDGALLFELTAESPGDGLGFDGVAVGDATGDGRCDVAVSGYHASSEKAFVALHSGADSKLVWSIDGEGPFGGELDRVGDVDGDGRADVLVRVGWTRKPSRPTEVLVLSGADGSVLRRATGCAGCGMKGGDIGFGGDINADGVPDFLLSDDEWMSATIGVQAFSGKDGARLYEWKKTDDFEVGFGWSIRGAGDVNRDGYGDVVFSETSPWGPEHADYVAVGSGKDGSILYTWYPPPAPTTRKPVGK